MKELDFKVGDLITTYHSGYWVCTAIEERSFGGDMTGYIIQYTKKYNADGSVTNRKIKESCGSDWCGHYKSKIPINILELEVMINALKFILENEDSVTKQS